MDGWVGGWMDGWMDREMNGWICVYKVCFIALAVG